MLIAEYNHFLLGREISSFVFKDIRTRTRAFEELESGEARKLLRKFSQWGSFYIAVS